MTPTATRHHRSDGEMNQATKTSVDRVSSRGEPRTPGEAPTRPTIATGFLGRLDLRILEAPSDIEPALDVGSSALDPIQAVENRVSADGRGSHASQAP